MARETYLKAKELMIDGKTLLDLTYPVGSLYWSSKNIDPSTLFGGTWEAITDNFVYLGDPSKNSSGITGGSKEVLLTVDNLPSHSHGMEHYHDKGTLRIQGTLGGAMAINWKFKEDGCIYTTSPAITTFSGDSVEVNYPIVHIDTDKGGFSGRTSGSQSFSGAARQTTNTAGNNVPVEIMPPYVTKYCWERIS